MHYTYIIESAISGNWYYGYSSNVERRLTFHNEGLNRSTRYGVPWRIIFIRGFSTKSDALKFERYSKECRNKQFIKTEFKEFFIK